MVVLVTGANGQLGQSIQHIAAKYLEIQFVFCTSSELDITNKFNCSEVFLKYKPAFCINAAAYTAVDKAESEIEKAHAVNVIGAKNLAEACKENNVILLHVSTDFVFDGSNTIPYTEDFVTNPIGVYGKTKLEGELAILKTIDQYYIVRTSWVYSQFASNFMKTMLRLASERDTLSVVNDQIGTPTYAVDLAEALIQIVITDSQQSESKNFGIYNFSNEGVCSWYDFAKEIFRLNGISITVNPIPTSAFPTPAKRPSYSVLDKTKIKNIFGFKIKSWEESLKTASVSS